MIEQVDLERYDRQLNWFGINLKNESPYKIQREIFNKEICLFGIGSLGGLLLMELAAMGFRNFTIIDKDNVEVSNLNRQILYTKQDIGKAKVLVAKRWLKSFDDKINIRAVKKDINSYKVLQSTLDRYDLLILTADEPKSNIVYWTSQYCALNKIPWVRFSKMGIGPLYAKKSDSCAACLLPSVAKDGRLVEFLKETNLLLNLSKSVIISEISFIISVMAHETILYLLGFSDHLQNTQLSTTFVNNNFKLEEITVRKSSSCACSNYV